MNSLGSPVERASVTLNMVSTGGGINVAGWNYDWKLVEENDPGTDESIPVCGEKVEYLW